MGGRCSARIGGLCPRSCIASMWPWPYGAAEADVAIMGDAAPSTIASAPASFKVFFRVLIEFSFVRLGTFQTSVRQRAIHRAWDLYFVVICRAVHLCEKSFPR